MTRPLVSTADAPNGVRTLTLDRPEVHNAFDDALIAELTGALEAADADEAVRVVVLTGAGRSFSAGADIGWMKRAGTYGEAENLADAEALARLLTTLDRLAKPTVARVNGAVIGGGMGLVCACDIAIALEHAVFATTEVRLGIVPAVISPFVIRAIGQRQARRLFLTGERVGARHACLIGLVHEVASDETALDEAVARVVTDVLQGGPLALDEAKKLVAMVATQPADDARLDEAVRLIARLRAGNEAKEGLGAFLAKRSPGWSA
ncbi:MAG: enoyl-CoA hydratase-related protein [Pseudomonadota bacterium]